MGKLQLRSRRVSPAYQARVVMGADWVLLVPQGVRLGMDLGGALTDFSVQTAGVAQYPVSVRAEQTLQTDSSFL